MIQLIQGLMAWAKIIIFGLILAYPVMTAWNYVMTDFGLQKQNLIGEISPVVNGAEDVESPTLVGVVKRQSIIV